nr:MAG TPA: hypothetical protein [Bacteriophage sp.]
MLNKNYRKKVQTLLKIQTSMKSFHKQKEMKKQ